MSLFTKALFLSVLLAHLVPVLFLILVAVIVALPVVLS